MTKVALILLAAGESRRMGTSKQLLTIDGKPLLEKMMEEAANVNDSSLIVVLGARAEEHLPLTSSFQKAQIVNNPNWANGMGSSVKAGLSAALEMHSDGALFFLCDQPTLTSRHLQRLIKEFKEHDCIVASAYNGVVGVPVIFPSRYFQGLLNLSDNEGARKLIETHIDNIKKVPFPGGEIDLDTPEDYDRFRGWGKE